MLAKNGDIAISYLYNLGVFNQLGQRLIGIRGYLLQDNQTMFDLPQDNIDVRMKLFKFGVVDDRSIYDGFGDIVGNIGEEKALIEGRVLADNLMDEQREGEYMEENIIIPI